MYFPTAVTFTTTERSISTMTAVPTTETWTTATKPAAKGKELTTAPKIHLLLLKL